MKLSTVLLSVAGAVTAAPASAPAHEFIRSLGASTSAYTGAEIVARLAVLRSVSPAADGGSLHSRDAEDPNVCYADCILDGGSDWECICRCVACGGKTPPPPASPPPPPPPAATAPAPPPPSSSPPPPKPPKV